MPGESRRVRPRQTGDARSVNSSGIQENDPAVVVEEIDHAPSRKPSGNDHRSRALLPQLDRGAAKSLQVLDRTVGGHRKLRSANDDDPGRGKEVTPDRLTRFLLDPGRRGVSSRHGDDSRRRNGAPHEASEQLGLGLARDESDPRSRQGSGELHVVELASDEVQRKGFSRDHRGRHARRAAVELGENRRVRKQPFSPADVERMRREDPGSSAHGRGPAPELGQSNERASFQAATTFNAPSQLINPRTNPLRSEGPRGVARYPAVAVSHRDDHGTTSRNTPSQPRL